MSLNISKNGQKHARTVTIPSGLTQKFFFCGLIILDITYPIDITNSTILGINFQDSTSAPNPREILFFPTLYFLLQFLSFSVPETIKWSTQSRKICRIELDNHLTSLHHTATKMGQQIDELFQGDKKLANTVQQIADTYRSLKAGELASSETPFTYNQQDKFGNLKQKFKNGPEPVQISEIEGELLILFGNTQILNKSVQHYQNTVKELQTEQLQTNRRFRFIEIWNISTYFSLHFLLPTFGGAWCLYTAWPF